MATLYNAEEADVICAGASARSLAFSCLRAGLRPVTCDLFYDSDLAARCPGTRIAADTWPEGLLGALAQLPSRPVIYSGGLENHPDLISRIENRHEILGNGSAVLARALDPSALNGCLARAGLTVAEIRQAGEEAPGESGWLSKPIRSGGGIGIEAASKATTSEGRYLQRFVDGVPASALFIASENEPSKRSLLLGATEQLIGESWLGAAGFTYCGNLGPLELEDEALRQVVLAGEAVGGEFSLRGLFGLDFILSPGGPVFIELNPRYTGSVEVIERCCGFETIPQHVSACRNGELPPIAPPPSKACAKAILFAETPVALSASPALVEESAATVADIPASGETIEPGSPLLTVLTEGADLANCEANLVRLAREARALFE
ncbi:MAG: ATP-grasp domain-containing protein [Planctomycetota bacterium]|nr:ATP-grasp domain-containing protein [Planctomycetota bacterium]